MPRGAEIHHLLQGLGQPVLVDLAGLMGVDIDRERLGDADGVAELDRAALGEAGGDDVLGEIAGGIGGGAVDLGRILAREGAAAMGRRAAIGVDDDLAPGEAAIAVGTADHEAAGRIDVELLLRAHPALGQHVQHMGPHDLAHLGLLEIGAMLGRDHDRGRPDRLAVDILQGDLALGVGPEAGLGAGMAGLGQGAQDLMGVIDRRRHELRRLAAGIAEHDALVAGALVLVARAHRRPGRCRPIADGSGYRPWSSSSGSRPAHSRCREWPGGSRSPAAPWSPRRARGPRPPGPPGSWSPASRRRRANRDRR